MNSLNRNWNNDDTHFLQYLASVDDFNNYAEVSPIDRPYLPLLDLNKNATFDDGFNKRKIKGERTVSNPYCFKIFWTCHLERILRFANTDAILIKQTRIDGATL